MARELLTYPRRLRCLEPVHLKLFKDGEHTVIMGDDGGPLEWLDFHTEKQAYKAKMSHGKLSDRLLLYLGDDWRCVCPGSRTPSTFKLTTK